MAAQPGVMRPRIEHVRPRAGDILGRFSTGHGNPEEATKDAFHELIVKSREQGYASLNEYLEEMDPTNDYPTSDPLSQMDAFDRQLYMCGIRTKSDPGKFIFAHTVDRFYASDQAASPILFPEFINRQIRVPMLAPPILDEIIAITTPIDSDSYRTIYLQDTTANRRMGRVAEFGELPTVKIATSEKSIQIRKYGVRLVGSYEAFRRMRIDLFALHIARIALQSMLDKSQEAVDVAINGDGNSNPATNYNLSALDPNTTAGHLTYYAWLRWLMSAFPYQITTVVGNQAELLSVLTLQFPNINPLMLLSMLQSDNGPVNMKVELAQGLWTTVRLVYLQTMPLNVLLGINKSTALEMILETNASLTETDRVISRQINEIAISEVVGFGVIIPQSIMTLTLNA